MKITSLFSDKPYSALAIAVCFAVMLILPWLHLLPVDSAFHLSAYWVTLIGKIMCLALVALALDLVWGVCRHFKPRPWLVLCPRRLRLWYVSDAPDGR